jgi:hypothetical protein
MSKKYSSYDLQALKREERELMLNGISLYQCRFRLSSKYSIPLSTLYEWLDPKLREKDIARHRQYRTNPEFKNTEKAHMRVVRHIDFYLQEAFKFNKEGLNVKGLANRLKEVTGIQLSEKAIDNAVSKYEMKHHLSPIIKESGSGKYMLNIEFYREITPESPYIMS